MLPLVAKLVAVAADVCVVAAASTAVQSDLQSL
jgi:hypothetical protein